MLALWSKLTCFLCGHTKFRAKVIMERSRMGKEDRPLLNDSQAIGVMYVAHLHLLLPDDLVPASLRLLPGNWPFPKAIQPERGVRIRTSYHQRVGFGISDRLSPTGFPGPVVPRKQSPRRTLHSAPTLRHMP